MAQRKTPNYALSNAFRKALGNPDLPPTSMSMMTLASLISSVTGTFHVP